MVEKKEYIKFLNDDWKFLEVTGPIHQMESRTIAVSNCHRR